jgi:phage/plasmid-associated DNA primase
MREDFWQFDPTHTVFLATNHRPEVRGTDLAIWGRIKLVPFEVTIPKPEQDKKLPEKLRAELPGILRWIVEGCLEWQAGGLGEPDEVVAATNQYRQDMDILAEFISDKCVVADNASVGATPLYQEYQWWCQTNGETPHTQHRFGRQLRERGFRDDRDAITRRKVWLGIGLHTDDEPPDGGGGGEPPSAQPPDSGNTQQQEQAKPTKATKPYETFFEHKQEIFSSRSRYIGKRFQNVSDEPKGFVNGSDSNFDNESNSAKTSSEQQPIKQGELSAKSNDNNDMLPSVATTTQERAREDMALWHKPNDQLWRERQGDLEECDGTDTCLCSVCVPI